MREELANLNYCAEPFLSRAAVNLCWYYSAGGASEDKELTVLSNTKMIAANIANITDRVLSNTKMIAANNDCRQEKVVVQWYDEWLQNYTHITH